jgi:hypothetical protein
MKIVAFLERPARDVADIRSADVVKRVNGRCVLGFEVGWLATLVHNLSVAAFGAAMFRAGDNFGFHMGEDQSQCECQWTPGRGEPYRGARRCESDCDDYDYDYSSDADGPNGCTCGFNGDCNCPYRETAR